MNYRFLVADDVLASLDATSRRERAILSDHFRQIALYPHDYDRSWEVRGFEFYAKRFGRWSVTYCIDGAVKKVLILAIERLTLR